MRSPLGPGEFPKHFPSAVPEDEAAALRELCANALRFEPLVRQAGQSRSFAYLLFEKDPRFDVRAAYRALVGMFIRSPMHSDAARRFGPDFYFLLDFCSFRRQGLTVKEEALELHFDGGFIGDDQQAINYWVTLDDAGPGSPAPGIRFLLDAEANARVWAEFLQARAGGEPWSTTAEDLRGEGAEMKTIPVKAGDCLAFDSAVLHATQELDGCTAERISIEYRVCAASAVPARYRNNRARLGQVQRTGDSVGFRILRAGD